MPKGHHTTPRGRKVDPNKMVSKSQRLPQEVWDNTTAKFRREAILTAFRHKLNKNEK
jgi:hypothetical protein